MRIGFRYLRFMKAVLSFLIFFFASLLSVAQREDDEYVAPAKPDKKPWVWHENLFYGGGLGLAFGNVTAINVNPQVGVKVLPWLGTGVGVDYNFVGSSGRNIQTFGPTGFVRLRPVDFLIAQAEITQVFVRERFNAQEFSYNFPMALVGVGYQEGSREGGGFFIMIMTDLIDDPMSPFPGLTFRTGFSIGF